MRHRVKTKTLSRDTDHRRALLKNLASSLVLNKKIVTTTAKAKFVKPYIEKLITKAKGGANYNNVRYMRTKLIGEDTIKEILTEIGPKFASRNGGYTRIVKLANRGGDNAPMARIELLADKAKKAVKSETTTKKNEVEKPAVEVKATEVKEESNE